MATTIWHNPRCSKSRQTLQLLLDQGIQAEVFEYLKAPLNSDEIKRVLGQLNMTAQQLLRAKEDEAKQQNLADADDNTVIAAMIATPKLIERPIVVHQGKAAIGRPPESVLALFNA